MDIPIDFLVLLMLIILVFVLLPTPEQVVSSRLRRLREQREERKAAIEAAWRLRGDHPSPLPHLPYCGQ